MKRTALALLLLHVTLNALGDGGQRVSIAPLLATHWHQQAPYNNMSPVIADGNVKTVAGCVSIAASQVVFYWHRDNPEATSYDTPTYDYGKAPVTYSVLAGTPYHWELIRNSYTNQEPQEELDAVALLVYVVGTSAWLSYGSSTGGQINDVINSFSSQFRLNGTYAKKSDYTQGEWEELLYNELVHGRPVLYAGNNGGSGHAVVVDGYDAQNNLFHFNFGFGGAEDGYYTVDDVTGMDGYCDNQACVYNISPQQRNIQITIEGTEMLAQNTPTELTLNITNGSTLAINDLKLFISRGHTDYADSEVLWHYAGNIDNSGQMLSMPVTVTPKIVGNLCVLRLTDKENNVLHTMMVNVGEQTAIQEINANGERALEPSTYQRIYTLSGQPCTLDRPLSPGIYIVNGHKVVIK